jgi:carbon storage regulator
MLMLSRKTNESIRIGDDIRVIITRIGRGRVQVAVDAPREVRIRREELPEALDTFTLASTDAAVQHLPTSEAIDLFVVG